MKLNQLHQAPDVADFDFALLESLTKRKHLLAFECYAEISDKIFDDVPILQRDAFDASFFHYLSSCTVEEAYKRSQSCLVGGPTGTISINLGAQAAVGIIRFIQGKGDAPLPSLDAISARWFNLPSTAFNDPMVYEVYCRFLINLVRAIPASKSGKGLGPLQPWQLGSLIFWYTKIHILRQPDLLPHEFLASL